MKPVQAEKVKSVFTKCVVRVPVEAPEIPEKPEEDFFLTTSLESLPAGLRRENARVAFHPRQFHAAEVRVFFPILVKRVFPFREMFMSHINNLVNQNVYVPHKQLWETKMFMSHISNFGKPKCLCVT